MAEFYILTRKVHSLRWMIEPLYIFRSGDLELGIALRTTEYLGNETEYVPWSAASRELMFVSSMLQRNPLYGHYEVRANYANTLSIKLLLFSYLSI